MESFASSAGDRYHAAMRFVIIFLTAITLQAVTAAQDEVGDPGEFVKAMASLPVSARRAHVEAELEKAGFAPERRDYPVPGGSGVNVEVTLGDADGPAILLTAHHDARKGSKAANNNASGVAVLIDVLRSKGAWSPSFSTVENRVWPAAAPSSKPTEASAFSRH